VVPLGDFVDPSALAARAAAIFCANFERGLDGLASTAVEDVDGDEGAGDAGDCEELALGLEASRRCSANNASLDFGFAPSPGVTAAGEAGSVAIDEVFRPSDNRCKAVRGISGDSRR
jgi:hypothetical protein